MKTLEEKRGSFTSRDLSLIAVFAALYLGYAAVSSVPLRAVTLSIDLFFLGSALFVILTYITQKRWAATLLATVSGLILLGTPAPFPVHTTLSLVAGGIVFDGSLVLMKKRTNASPRTQFVIAGTLGNLALGIVGDLVLLSVGMLPLHPFYFLDPVSFQILLVVATVVAGALGALFGVTLVRRVRGSPVIERLK